MVNCASSTSSAPAGHTRPLCGDAAAGQDPQGRAAGLGDIRVGHLAAAVTDHDAVSAGVADRRALDGRLAASRDSRTVTGHVGDLKLPERRLRSIDNGDAVRFAVRYPRAGEDRLAVAVDPDAVPDDIGHDAVFEPAAGFGRHRDTAAGRVSSIRQSRNTASAPFASRTPSRPVSEIEVFVISGAPLKVM